LCANANTVADLDVSHVVADASGLTDNLVSNDERELAFAPSLLEGMDVGAADAAMGDGNLDVICGKCLGLESRDFQVRVVFRIFKRAVQLR
jgi:hypothetical protein